MIDKGTHFFNDTIEALTEEFQIHHQKSTPYNPQETRGVESFKKKLENALTNIYNANKNDLDVCIHFILLDYRTTCKKLTGKMPLRMVYGKEEIMPMECIIPSMRITKITNMVDLDIMEECVAQLATLEEYHFIANFHQ